MEYPNQEREVEFDNYNISYEEIGQRDILNYSNNSIDNKRSNNTLKTITAININSQCENFEFSFSKNNNEENNDIKNKELSKETIELLEEMISLESFIISGDNTIETNNNNKVNNIEGIKKNLLWLENNMNNIIKKPFMRKKERKININSEECNNEKKIIKISNNIPNFMKNEV